MDTKLYLLAILFILSGCTTKWYHPSHDSHQVMLDIQQCEEESQQTVQRSNLADLPNFSRSSSNPPGSPDNTFEERKSVSECLERRGYRKEPDHLAQ